MRFSVVIPAHNGEKYLSACIESVLYQVRAPDEIIIVDDASTDKTSLIANSNDYAGRIKYFFNEESTGFVDAWNRAISKATGNYVTILHQDDLLHPEYFEHIVKAMKKFPQVNHFYSACNYIDAFGLITREPPFPQSLEPVFYTGKMYAHNYLNGVISDNHIHRCPGVTTSRELLIKKCTYRREAGLIADDDFFYRIGRYTDVVGISKPLASFRHHSNSETGRIAIMTMQLARDYIFQASYHRSKESMLDAEGLKIIDRLAARFINLLLFEGCLKMRDVWIDESFLLAKQFQIIAPGFLKKNSTLWSIPLWFMAKSLKTRKSACIYARTLKSLYNIILK